MGCLGKTTSLFRLSKWWPQELAGVRGRGACQDESCLTSSGSGPGPSDTCWASQCNSTAAAALAHKCTSGNMSCLDHLPQTLFSGVFEKGLMKCDSEITDKCQPHLLIVSSKWERQWGEESTFSMRSAVPTCPQLAGWLKCWHRVDISTWFMESLNGGEKIKHYKSMSNIHNPEVLVVNNTKHRPNFYVCNLRWAIPSKWENLKGKNHHLLEYH